MSEQSQGPGSGLGTAASRAGMNPPAQKPGGSMPVPQVEFPPDETERLTSEIPNIETFDRKRQDAQFLECDPRTLDPQRYYRWVRIDEHSTSVARRKRQGFRIERTTGGVKTLVEPDKRGDDAIVIGDVVLMSCARSLHEQRVNATRRRTAQLLQSTSATTEEAAKEKGIEVIKDPDHNRTTTEIRP